MKVDLHNSFGLLLIDSALLTIALIVQCCL